MELVFQVMVFVLLLVCILLNGDSSYWRGRYEERNKDYEDGWEDEAKFWRRYHTREAKARRGLAPQPPKQEDEEDGDEDEDGDEEGGEDEKDAQ